MALSEVQKKALKDIALGKSINGRKSIEDQIAALRKQVVLLTDAAKVPIVAELQELEDIVAEEKAKKTAEKQPIEAEKVKMRGK